MSDQLCAGTDARPIDVSQTIEGIDAQTKKEMDRYIRKMYMQGIIFAVIFGAFLLLPLHWRSETNSLIGTVGMLADTLLMLWFAIRD
jgi:uncharacterized membrane protein